MLELAESHVLSIKPYVPGRAIENETGIVWAKLASNENCLGPSKSALVAVKRALNKAHLYPNAYRIAVIEKICSHLKDFSVRADQVALGNGSSELIVNLVRGLVSYNEAVLYNIPTFVMYSLATKAHNRKEIAVSLKEDFSYDCESMLREIKRKSPGRVKLVFLANPNNPTGTYIKKDLLKDFIKEIPKDVVLVIDEAYFEYVVERDYPNGLVYALNRPRTLILRTFSKIYGLAGMRLGYAVGDKNIIDILCRMRDPFNVNSLSQHAAIAALDDGEHVTSSVRHNLEIKPKLLVGLSDFGFLTFDSVGNFLLAKKNKTMPDINRICNQLLLHGVIIRPLESFGLKDAIRISVGTKNEIIQLFNALSLILKT